MECIYYYHQLGLSLQTGLEFAIMKKNPTNFHQLDKTQKLKVLLLYLAVQPQEVFEFHGFLKTHI